MARKNIRVVIPTNPEDLVKLGENIVAKHNEDPAASPIAGLDMEDFETKVTGADSKQKEAEKLRKDSETATEERDGLLGHRKDQNSNTAGTILNYVSRVRDILLGNFRGEEQKLGDYGFTVNQSSKPGSGGDEPLTE
jgi:hypothetical protein